MLPSINRTLLVIKAKQPMADWLATLPDKHETEIEHPITVNDINDDCAVYLAPDFDEPDEMKEYLQSIKPELFEEILDGWYTDENYWPKNRTPKEFDRWFDVEIHTVIHDLWTDEPLEREE